MLILNGKTPKTKVFKVRTIAPSAFKETTVPSYGNQALQFLLSTIIKLKTKTLNQF